MKAMFLILTALLLMPTVFASCNEDKSVCSYAPEKASYDLSKGGMFSSYELNGIKHANRVAIEIPNDKDYFEYFINYPVYFTEEVGGLRWQ